MRVSAVVCMALVVLLLVSMSGRVQQSAWKHARRAGALQRSDWEFGGWKVKVGDQITMDDPIAVMRDRLSGREKAIHASKDGTVLELRGYLHEGDIVQEHMLSGTDIATIGKFLEPTLGFMEAAVVVPDTDLVFEYFLVRKGDWVNAGDHVAQVTRLRAEAGTTARKLQAEFIKVQAPRSGHISWVLPLRPGRISEQSSSPVIAKVIVAVPWWPPLLLAVLTSCCCLVSLQQVMTDPKVAYTTVPPGSARTCSRTLPLGATSELGGQFSETSSLSEAPQGLRLDFEADGQVISVYAKHRPLGIQHSSEAPSVVCGFTVNSYAEAELGVQKGWKLLRIGAEQLDDSAAVWDKLDAYMEDLPIWPLLLEFEQSGGGSKVCSFNEGPIGLELTQKNPTRVGRVHAGGSAQSAGIREGWILTKIGSLEVKEQQGFWELSTALEEAVSALDAGDYRI